MTTIESHAVRTSSPLATESLIELARSVRLNILKMSCAAKAPHVGSAFSCTEILVALYFAVARVDPDHLDDPARDIVILSKGHASAALYATLAARGYFDESLLDTYCADDTTLAEHPSRGIVPGIDVTTGSLGHGLGVGAGLALAAKRRGSPSRVFAVLSDGECNEGSIWEAALWAPRHALGNLTAIIDFNRLQATGVSTEITQLEPLVDKWRAFGWDASEVDGHDLPALIDRLNLPGDERPKAIIAHTIKGKGVSFMEGNLEWHYRPPLGREFELACEEIRSAR